VLHLPLHAIREVVRLDPGAWQFLAFAMIDHIGVLIGASDDLMIRDPLRRFIAVLLRAAGCRTETPPGAEPIDIDASQDDLAAMANMARTSVNAALKKLEASGAVELGYRRIRILAPDGLRARLTE
jgi:CRP/FNR family transcriptional regulator, cyclic AMP receptor protein